MLKAIRSLVRLFGKKNDEHKTAETPKQTVVTPPETQQPRFPNYRPLNAAVEAARGGDYEKAHQALAQALVVLRVFPHTRSLYLAGAAVVNAEDSNLGIAGRLIEEATLQLERDYRRLSPAERNFVTTARDITLCKVPVNKLKLGKVISEVRQEAEELCNEGKFGEAITRLKHVARTTQANTCLQQHPDKPWTSLLAMIDDIYSAIERQDTTTRMNELYYGETGNPITRMEAAA